MIKDDFFGIFVRAPCAYGLRFVAILVRLLCALLRGLLSELRSTFSRLSKARTSSALRSA